MKKQEKIWQNRWICSPEFAKALPRQMLHKQLDPAFHLEEHREDLKNHHTLFRKKIWIQPGTRRVFLDISADDYYKLYINGAFVTQGPANSYPFCYYYNHVDITGAVRPGENMLCVHVYYQGLVNRAFNSGDYRQGMIAEVWADGKQIGLAPEGNHIVELIRERGLCCGVFTAYFVLYGLIRQGGKGACPGINC